MKKILKKIKRLKDYIHNKLYFFTYKIRKKPILYKTSTFKEILTSEHKMVADAPNEYGKFFDNAFALNSLLNNFIKSIDDREKYLFMLFYSQIKKHNTLALFSSVRRHHIQTGMNLRQVLEAGARMAYAIGNKEEHKFFKYELDGTISIPKVLNENCYNWLEQNFKEGSNSIKKLKDHINKSVAHSNIKYSLQNFKPNFKEGEFNFSFFDKYDEKKIKTDLWLIGNTTGGLIDLFLGINNKYKVFAIQENVIENLKELRLENDKLKTELMSLPGFSKYYNKK